MLVIRLQRTGRENTPTYRIVVSEKTRSAKKGAHEILGHFIPTGKTTFVCDTERVAYWISKGAIPSDTMARLLKKNGVEGMEKYMIKYTKQRSKKAPPEEVAAPAAAPAPEASAEAAPAPEEPKKEEAPAA